MNPAIFICGCGHSGTSLMAAIFAANSRVYVPLIESEMFLKPRDVASERYLALMTEARENGKEWLVEKTPRHIRKLLEIRTLVPGARFIVPVRDGRDVVASIARRTGKAETGVKRWIGDNSLVLAERDSPDVWVYRHEDLIDDPPGVVAAACAFSGIPFEEGMLRYHETERLWFRQKALKRGSGIGREHGSLRNWQINQPIFDNRGRWKSELSPEDVAPLVEGRGRSIMEAFGYLTG